LEGSLEPETLREIEPALSLGEIAEGTRYTDFAGFIGAYVWVNRKLRSPEHYAIAARRLFENLHAQGVVYAEVTISAGVILWKNQDLGATFDALAREAARASLVIRWILDATRQWGPVAAQPVFDFAAERRREGVVAIGLGGFEAEGPALWFRDLFAEARDRGLRLTCHAGETTGPRSVWEALEIGAERIGHGIFAVQDDRLMKHLRAQNIPLEICISSNLRCNSGACFARHPVRELFDAGVAITLNTDDPALFGCTLASEYDLARREFGLPVEELAANAFRFAFDLPDSVARAVSPIR